MTTSPEERAFLAAICADPADDTARLVYADWLDDHGRPGDACEQRLAVQLRAIKADPADDVPRLRYADVCQQYGQGDRAEFIRVQIGYAQLYPHFVAHDDAGGNEDCPDCSIAAALSDLLLGKFAVPLRSPAPFAADCPYRIAKMESYTGEMVEWDWYRGFVSEVRCPGAWWLEHGDSIAAQHPVTAVTLTSAPRVNADVSSRTFSFAGDAQKKAFSLADLAALLGSAPGYATQNIVRPLLRLRWPTITTFTLPSDPVRAAIENISVATTTTASFTITAFDPEAPPG